MRICVHLYTPDVHTYGKDLHVQKRTFYVCSVTFLIVKVVVNFAFGIFFFVSVTKNSTKISPSPPPPSVKKRDFISVPGT